MEIEIQSHGFAVTNSLRNHVTRRLEAALAPFKGQVRRVIARLGDENGPRGGNDKSCRIGVSVGGAPDVFAADTRADLYAAIDGAADRLGAALAHRLNRRRNLKRLRHAQAQAEQLARAADEQAANAPTGPQAQA